MPFFTENHLVVEQRTKPNFLVEYDETCCNRSSCCIYFSSNGLYYPNTEETFRKQVIEKDNYEWYKTRRPVYKHIFVRDVFKQWYALGINKEVNTLEKFLIFLKQETAGYDSITTIGSSAGGYFAILSGYVLNADLVIASCPQCDLHEISEDKEEGPVWYRYKNELSRYLNISWAITQNVFYIYSTKSEIDIKQRKLLTSTTEHTLRIDSNIHGVPFTRGALDRFMAMDKEELFSLPLNWTYKLDDCEWMLGRSACMLSIIRYIPFHLHFTYRRRIKHAIKDFIAQLH